MKSHEGLWDRCGILASVACAAHCLAAPLVFLALPKFASIWAHPASHALVALFVLPMAGTVLRSGYRRHGRKWVASAALVGMGLIGVGSVLPYLGGATNEVQAAATDEDSPCASCCPQVVDDAQGRSRLVIPPASLVTVLGSLFLVGSHLGNLLACRCCRRESDPVAVVSGRPGPLSPPKETCP